MSVNYLFKKMVYESKMPVFVINLENRVDRKQSIIEQFNNKLEFKLNVVSAIKHGIGSLGLWQTMQKIVAQAQSNNDEYIVICEDDHLFTEHYNSEKLFNAIEKANELNADLLLGGVSHFDDAVEFENHLFWLSGFTGFQFAIIYQRLYERFLSVELQAFENIDIKMKDISDKIFCIYPFISVQKEFGYSDVTKKNEQEGVVDEYFIKSEKRLKTLSFLRKHFDNLNTTKEYAK